MLPFRKFNFNDCCLLNEWNMKKWFIQRDDICISDMKKLFFHGDVVYISNSKSNYRTTLLHIIWRQEKYIFAIKR